MRSDLQIPSTGGAAADPDPRTSPEQVPDRNVGDVPATMLGTDQSPQTLVVALEGTTGQSATIQLWTIEDPVNTQIIADPKAEKAARRYYSVGEPLTLSVGDALTFIGEQGSGANVLIAKVPCPIGRVYLQVTTRPAADATIKVGWLGA